MLLLLGRKAVEHEHPGRAREQVGVPVVRARVGCSPRQDSLGHIDGLHGHVGAQGQLDQPPQRPGDLLFRFRPRKPIARGGGGELVARHVAVAFERRVEGVEVGAGDGFEISRQPPAPPVQRRSSRPRRTRSGAVALASGGPAASPAEGDAGKEDQGDHNAERGSGGTWHGRPRLCRTTPRGRGMSNHRSGPQANCGPLYEAAPSPTGDGYRDNRRRSRLPQTPFYFTATATAR